jgi:hypothetical protein
MLSDAQTSVSHLQIWGKRIQAICFPCTAFNQIWRGNPNRDVRASHMLVSSLAAAASIVAMKTIPLSSSNDRILPLLSFCTSSHSYLPLLYFFPAASTTRLPVAAALTASATGPDRVSASRAAGELKRDTWSSCCVVAAQIVNMTFSLIPLAACLTGTPA